MGGALALLLQPAVASPRGIALPAVNQAATSYKNPRDPRIARLFRRALLNSLRDAALTGDGTVYVRTGDIHLEWLRDSSAQVRPYLFFVTDSAVREFIRGVIARQASYIQIDPYANAFSPGYLAVRHKFQLDSLCYPVLLAWTYWKVTGDNSIFTPSLHAALRVVLDTMLTEQQHPTQSSYRDKRLPDSGQGRPVGPTGMIWSGFRPSDDASTYNYPIASELMAVQALGALTEMEGAFGDTGAASMADQLRTQVNAGIQTYGIVDTRRFGDVYAYEVDGLGRYKLMDDANVPSLLSAPYLGYGSTSDPVYQDTRRLVLSGRNPYYYSGRIGSGIGSSHTTRGQIWPMALVVQALTSASPSEGRHVLHEILASDPGDRPLPESFDANDPKVYRRKQFGWPNSLFSELILTRYEGMAALPTPSTADLPIR